MHHSELLRLMALRLNLEGKKSEDGQRFMYHTKAIMQLFFALRSRYCSGALSICAWTSGQWICQNWTSSQRTGLSHRQLTSICAVLLKMKCLEASKNTWMSSYSPVYILSQAMASHYQQLTIGCVMKVLNIQPIKRDCILMDTIGLMLLNTDKMSSCWQWRHSNLNLYSMRFEMSRRKWLFNRQIMSNVS